MLDEVRVRHRLRRDEVEVRHRRRKVRITLVGAEGAAPRPLLALGVGSAHGGVVAECEAALRRIVNPEEADRLAKADQRAHIDKHGGKEAILKRGTFRYSPPSGVKAAYY